VRALGKGPDGQRDWIIEVQLLAANWDGSGTPQHLRRRQKEKEAGRADAVVKLRPVVGMLSQDEETSRCSLVEGHCCLSPMPKQPPLPFHVIVIDHSRRDEQVQL
jgi:hypothetical protein